ncbi:MAG: tRNA uridine-5-carboxymethylaminomethyl(34) synthesis GTPase MnmE [Gammaproteobacteria bacterium]|nr:tRNA uridine-5-carboxymethylaminomethyl(34) synthesis GTPase MnmE [Gammaproteobacteria bacterium]
MGKPADNSGSVETIAAQATPPGLGGVGIIRVSGPRTRVIAQALLGRLPPPRHAVFSEFRDARQAAIDQGVALFFPAPRSFTGEDVLELHGHGGPAVMNLLLQRVLEAGARLARPGEFSERAFLNGKLDLAQAEAVADLIAAASDGAARAALRSLQGVFSQRVHALVETLTALRTHIEAAIDFPEEEIDFLADADLQTRCRRLIDDIASLQRDARHGRLLHDGLTVVLAGPPNAGKSSLLNALAQQESAIVSPTPGTTRDVLREQIVIDGIPLHVLDTAGLRDSHDDVEREGVRRARAAAQQADHVLIVVDDSAPHDAEVQALLGQLPAGIARTLVRNKIDKTGRPPGTIGATAGLAVSALTGAGLDALRARLKDCAGFAPSETGNFSARRRHLEAIERARAHIDKGLGQLTSRQGELVAEELRHAQQALGEITGEFSPDDLLDRIFSSFCIGK